MKRMLSILLSVVLVLGLLPMSAAAVNVTETTNADFSQTDTTPAINLLNKSGTVATWDGTTKTLTFTDNLTFKAAATPALVLPPDATVNIADGKTVSITCTLPPDVRSSCGLSALGSLTITGGGTLNITAAGKSTAGYAYPSYGLSVISGTLTVNGPTVTCTGGNISGSSSGGASEGIDAISASIVVESGILTAKGGDVSCSGGSVRSYGAYSKSFTVNGGTVTLEGGAAVTSVSSNDGEAASYGVYAGSDGAVRMTGGTVTAKGGTASGDANSSVSLSAYSSGINAIGAVVDISGGTLTATGGNVTVTNTKAGESYSGYSRGIYYGGFPTAPIIFSNCDITASSGTVSIAGDDGYKSSVAVSLNNYKGLDISGATITASGGSGGIECTTGAVNVTDSTVTATGKIGIVPRDMTVNGTSAVTATGVTNGIYCFRGDLTLNGGTINATAETPTGNSEVCLAAAIDAEGVSVTGGHLIAEGSIASGDADDTSYGILCESIGVMSVSAAADTLPDGAAAFSGGITELKGTTKAIKASKIITSNGLKPIYASETFTSGTTAELTQASAPKPVIIAIPLTVTGVTVKTKVYDGKKDATLDISGADLKDGDNNTPSNVALSAEGAKAEFSDKNAGTSKSVTITSGLTLTGDNAAQYVLTQPTGLTGTIKPCTTVTAVPTLSLTFTKGATAFPSGWAQGVSINSGGVTGTTHDTATGTYTYGWTPAGGSEVSGKTAAETATYLNTLADKTALNVSFVFSGTGNYAGASLTGNIAVTVADARAFITGGTEATTANALTVKASPVYGDTWADIVKINNGIYAQIGDNAANKDTNKSHFTLSVSGKPSAGNGQAYSILYNGTINGTAFTNAAVLTGIVNVAPKALTVKPKDLTVYVNATAPTLELEYSGLLTGDTLSVDAAPVFELKDSAGAYLQKEVDDGSGGVTTADITDPTEALAEAVKQAGTYKIIWTNQAGSNVTGTPLANYTVTKTDEGTLTVSNRPVYTPPAEEPEECDGGESCVSHSFSDVDTKQWYHEAVDYAIENKLMNGMGGGKFDPKGTLTRGMLCQIFYNKEGRPAVTAENPFTDVPADAWYANAVVWAYENKIVEGYGNGKFGPNDYITREQLATILWRYDGKSTTGGSLSGFTDGGKTSDFAITPMQWAVEKKIVSGKGNGILDPIGKAQRCEVAAMVMRYLVMDK